MWSKTLIGTGSDTLTDVVAMPTGVAAFGETNTTDPVGSSMADIWVVRVNYDGMVNFRRTAASTRSTAASSGTRTRPMTSST